MNFLRSIEERYLRVALCTLLVSVIAIISSIYCFFVNLADVPIGFALGGVVVSGLYVFAHFMLRLDERNGTAKFSIITILVRNVLLIGVMIILAFLYYYWKIRLFNLFAFVGIYTVGVIFFVIDHLIFK